MSVFITIMKRGNENLLLVLVLHSVDWWMGAYGEEEDEGWKWIMKFCCTYLRMKILCVDFVKMKKI